MRFVVDGAPAVRRLRTDRDLRRVFSEIVVRRLAGPIDQDPLERALNRHYFSCGCAQRAAAVHIGLLIGGTMWAWGVRFEPWRWWKLALLSFGRALVGKLIGIAVSKWRLRSIYRALELEFRSGGEPPAERRALGLGSDTASNPLCECRTAASTGPTRPPAGRDESPQ